MTTRTLQNNRDTASLSDIDILASSGFSRVDDIFDSRLLEEYSLLSPRIALNYQALDRLITKSLYKIKYPRELSLIGFHGECSICLEGIYDKVLILDCHHSFHYCCIKKWNNNSCPYCRETIDKSVPIIHQLPLD